MVISFISQHSALIASLSFFTTLLVVLEVLRLKNKIPSLAASDVVRMINDKDAILVDIRSANEYAARHIPKSLHITANQLKKQETLLKKHASNPIIIYCQHGMSSVAAAEQLRQMGLENIYHMRGGITAWETDRLPTTNKVK